MPRSVQPPQLALSGALHSKVWPFDRMTVYDAVEAAGVYALWRYGEVIFYGCAPGGESTIRTCLAEHLSGLRAAPTQMASHWSSEVCAHPQARHVELLSSFWASYGRRPACNADAVIERIVLTAPRRAGAA